MKENALIFTLNKIKYCNITNLDGKMAEILYHGGNNNFIYNKEGSFKPIFYIPILKAKKIVF